MQRLILFDIDGTLLTSNGVAARAFRAALEEVFGTSGPRGGYSFAGKTDPQIARDLLRAAGIDEPRVQQGLEAAWELYLEALARDCRSECVQVYPGVHRLLDRLEEAPERALLGLLTGNMREGARIKLQAGGIDFGRFRVGAFGSDHAERRELPAIAIRRAEELLGHRFTGKSVVIIGDTPLDIACGEHLGVRTIAVATGTYSEEELERCGPDYLFASLEDTEAVWKAIFA
jgi:phosphoglycolate phosphatase